MVATYVLAPNFTYHPNTSICMGDIVEYPDDPTKPLSSVPPANLKPITRHLDYDFEASTQSTHSLHGSIWATFLQQATAKISGGTSDDLFNKYTALRLETIYFTKQPTDEEAAERVREKAVKAAVNAGLLMKKPVFMITGLKVARGFQVSSSISSTANAKGEFKAPITSNSGMGADADHSQGKKQEQNHRSRQDIIFAYQLHAIIHKGWSQKHVDITVHKPTAAFLNGDQKKNMEDAVSMEMATEPILHDFDPELKMEIIRTDDCDFVVFEEE
nr:hypothetical protein FVER53263_20540 [Fusarium verticillioides]